MKFSLLLCIGFAANFNPITPASAQVYSVNIVGFCNREYPAGDNLIANPLSFSNNTLNSIFIAGLPSGSTLSLWNTATARFLAPSIYTAGSGWSIDYSLSPGGGALLHLPTICTQTYVGEVLHIDSSEGILPVPPPLRADGVYLLSTISPMDGGFYELIGRGAREGESVYYRDLGSMAYVTTTYRAGGWDNGEPRVRIAESAFFNLGPVSAFGLDSVAIPEPSTSFLLVAFVFATVGAHRLRRLS